RHTAALGGDAARAARGGVEVLRVERPGRHADPDPVVGRSDPPPRGAVLPRPEVGVGPESLRGPDLSGPDPSSVPELSELPVPDASNPATTGGKTRSGPYRKSIARSRRRSRPAGTTA